MRLVPSAILPTCRSDRACFCYWMGTTHGVVDELTCEVANMDSCGLYLPRISPLQTCQVTLISELEGQTSILLLQFELALIERPAFQNFLFPILCIRGWAKEKMTLICVCQPWHP